MPLTGLKGAKLYMANRQKEIKWDSAKFSAVEREVYHHFI